MQDFSHAYQTDLEHKYSGVSDDIFHFKDIHEKKWDFSLPTVVSHTYNDESNPELTRYRQFYTHNYGLGNGETKFPKSFDEFLSRWNVKYPFFNKLDYSGIIIAGGCLQNLLKGANLQNEANIDIDVFFVNITEEQAINKIKYFSNLFDKKYIITYLRSQKALTMILNTQHMVRDHIIDHNNQFYSSAPTHIQFIFRIYSSPSEVLHSFDLPSCSVGFDGKQLLFTSGSKFAYEYGCNYIEPRCRSTTYEFRIHKYWYRGFNIIFPHLKFNSSERTIVLPGLAIEKTIIYYNNHNFKPFFDDPIKIKNLIFATIKHPDKYFSYPHDAYAWINNSDYMQGYLESDSSAHMGFLNVINSKNYQQLMLNDPDADKNIFIVNSNLDAILLNQLDINDFIQNKINTIINGLHPSIITNTTVTQAIRDSFNPIFKIINDFNLRNKSPVNFSSSQKGSILSAAFNPVVDEHEWSWYGHEHYVPNPTLRCNLVRRACLGDKEAIELLIKFYSDDGQGDWFLNDEKYIIAHFRTPIIN